ncbi:MAG: hypothetical protein IT426_03215 [Pirellulales bacterium]|nr:hypothetical protein [Pirellulales bacterium]
MSPDPATTESSLEEQLVAYLDGELDAEAVRRIEERLAAEPEVRETLNRLERTWEMLDELGATPVGESFTQTTLEMVAVAAEDDVRRAMAEVPLRRRRRWRLACAGVFAAAAAGFGAAFLALPNSNRQLLADLPVLENLEEYRQVDDIEFLRLLRQKGLSLHPSSEPPVEERPSLENVPAADLASRVASLSPGEKADLAQKKASFENLNRSEREKIQRLHQEIRNDADAAELRRIMHDYYLWWKNLSPYDKNELSSLSSPPARIARIELLKQEELKRTKNLSEGDVAALRDWMKQYVAKFEDRYREYLKTLSPEKRKAWEDKRPEERRWDTLRFFRQQWQPWQRGGNKSPPPEELAALRAKLSPEIQAMLQDKPPLEQWRIIQGWLHSLPRQKFDAPGGRGPNSLVDENEIAEFFKGLPREERERLLNLPPEILQHELQRRYLSRMNQMQPFVGRPEGPFSGGPPGPRGFPDWRPPNKSK